MEKNLEDTQCSAATLGDILGLRERWIQQLAKDKGPRHLKD